MTSVYEFIQAKHPEELTEIEIPSVSVVGNAFLPSNPYVGVTKSSHRINVVRRLTTKQMHKKHIDTHACNTLRRTVKDLVFELSQELSKSRSSEVTCLSFYGGVEEELLSVIDSNARLNVRQCFRYISCDDKAKIPIGEPFHPISTGCRQRIGNIVPANQELQATQVLDHDFSKASLTPSVELDINIPDRREKSWFDGNVHFVMHDSIFEASNGWFHAVNLIMRILTEGANAANLPSPKSLQEYLEYDEKTRRQILFYVPFLIVLSTDGKF